MPVVPVVLAWVAAGVLAAVDWWSVVRGRPAVERWAKPAVMLAIAGAAVAAGALGSEVGRWVLVALGFGLVGDVLLLGDTQGRFLGGLAAFLLGHLAWVAGFLAAGPEVPVLAVVGGAVVVLALVGGRAIVPGAYRQGGPTLAGPVVLYMAVIAAMALTGWATGLLAVGLGATLFVVSDTVLGLGRFDREHTWTRPVVMVTYHVAQALLVVGLLGLG
jgi:uncharacterized membrane protein YhhN